MKMDWDIFDEVAKIIMEELDVNRVLEFNTIKDLGGDSLNLVQISIAIEDKYRITFPKDLSRFKTVKDLVMYIQENANIESVKSSENSG